MSFERKCQGFWGSRELGSGTRSRASARFVLRKKTFQSLDDGVFAESPSSRLPGFLMVMLFA
jgi:hypothetical protein